MKTRVNSMNTGNNITAVNYNYLNLPQSVTATAGNVTYTYDGDGRKLRSVNGINGQTRDYVDGIEYTGGTMEMIQTEEGRITRSGSTYTYHYFLRDHLGNNRVGFTQGTNVTTPDFTADYYPFGLQYQSDIRAGSPINNYLYNGKEYQNGIKLYDYGARLYDPVIGRWEFQDNFTELYFSNSGYSYSLNNPINAVDPDGNVVIFINGNHFGSGAKGYYPTYSQNNMNYDFNGTRDYWTDGKRNFDYEIQDQLNDHSPAIYRDGALGGWFGLGSLDVGLGNYNANSASDRKKAGYDQGSMDAMAIVNNLDKNTSGEITESIKIITHSMGGAYGKGYVKALKEYISTLPKDVQKQIKIALVADFDPYQAGNLKADRNIKTQQFMHIGYKNIFGMGWLANEYEQDLDPANIFMNTGTSTDHSIFSFFNDISSL